MSGAPTLPAPSALEACDAVCERMIDQHGTTAYGVDWSALRKSIRAALASGATQPSDYLAKQLAIIGGELSVSGQRGLRHLETNLGHPRGAGVHIASGKDEAMLCAIVEVVNAALATPPTGEPLTGFALVPLVPTEKMVDAFENAMETATTYVRNFKAAYSAMLAAAPTRGPKQTPQEVKKAMDEMRERAKSARATGEPLTAPITQEQHDAAMALIQDAFEEDDAALAAAAAAAPSGEEVHRLIDKAIVAGRTDQQHHNSRTMLAASNARSEAIKAAKALAANAAPTESEPKP